MSSDVIYSPIWTTGVTVPTGETDAPISYTYGGATGLSVPAPTNVNCAPWSAQCRATIHYAATLSGVSTTQIYLQALWNLSTRTASINGVATPVVCVTCHNPVSAMKAIQVPSDSLDLTGGTSSVDTTVVQSYEQLLFPRDEQSLNMGILLNTVPEPGPVVNGMPTTIEVTVPLTSPLAAGSAAGSTAFLRMFDGTFHDPVLDHTGYLTPAELRLISEWLDIGGQYYNDPFVAPVAN
jgi:hypothetical protein